MLTNPTIETLKALKLQGMIQALEEQQQNAAVNALSFEERIALIVDRERLYRDNQRRTRLLRGARLKVVGACVEDINYKAGARPGQAADRLTRQRRMDRPPPESSHHGRDRRGQDVACVRLGATSLPSGNISSLLAGAPSYRGAARRSRRWQLHQVPQSRCKGITHRARRLGTDCALDAGPGGSAGDLGRPRQRRLDVDREPVTGRHLACLSGRADPRRRHPGPPGSSQPPDRAQGAWRIDAQTNSDGERLNWIRNVGLTADLDPS